MGFHTWDPFILPISVDSISMFDLPARVQEDNHLPLALLVDNSALAG